jgi:hypothetical protein
MPAKSKILNRVAAAYVVRDSTGTFGSTTVSPAALAKGATSINIASGTNFANGDVIRIGSGDEMELCRVTAGGGTTTLTVANPLAFAHAIGEAVVEQTVYDLGDTDEGGVTLEATGEVIDLTAATKRLVFQSLTGYVSLSGMVQLHGLSMHNLAVALGIPFASVTGAGTAADYYQLVTDGNDFLSEQNMSFIVVGTTMDGSVVRCELWGCDMDYSSISFTLGRGKATPVPLKFVASAGGVLDANANPYTPSSTFKAGKGKVFDALSEFGIFVDTGTTNTVASGGAAGNNSVTLTNAAGFTAGLWVKFGSGETVEYHQIHSVATNTLTMKSRFLRAQAAATVATVTTPTAVAGVSPDGGTVNINGSVEPLRIATKRIQVGLRPGPATLGIQVPITDLSLANWAYALGIPQADIASARVALTNLGTATDIVGLYLKGTMKDGTTLWMNGWGCTQVVEQFSAALAASGQPSLLFNVRPSSALQCLNHA